ncbi:hypothetical protein [Psychrobacter sp. H8-1]|uniref:hypothetical protein n=1 Tax=Psychrobacter sp. H8-1 TaxID=2774129 RepID=UPI00191A17B6|nr:hypothetical protein [Psychrobacter sp. H8-1]
MSILLTEYYQNQGIPYLNVPKPIQDFIEHFEIDIESPESSPDVLIVSGNLKPTDSYAFPKTLDVGIGDLTLPLTNGGFPVRLIAMKDANGTVDGWQLEIFLSNLILTVEGLRPAIYVPEQGTAPRHLLADPKNNKVQIIGQSAWLRLSSPVGTSGVDFSFVEQPQSAEELQGSQAFSSVFFSPSSFFIGSSDFGLIVGKVVFDFSEQLSPAFISNASVGPDWMGLAIQEATFYAPRNLPLVGDLSGGVREVLLGKPFGLYGELEVQFGRSPLDPSTFEFRQQDITPDIPLEIAGSGLSRKVEIVATQEENVLIDVALTAAAPTPDGNRWTARWTWGDNASEEGLTTTGTAWNTRKLIVEPIEIIVEEDQETRLRHPAITFRFKASGTAPTTVRAHFDNKPYEKVIHVSGTAADISTIKWYAVPTLPADGNATHTDNSTYQWELTNTALSKSGQGVVFDLSEVDADESELLGHHTIKLTKTTVVGSAETKQVNYLQLEILAAGDLLFGTQNGVFSHTDENNPVKLAAVEANYELSAFLTRGILIFHPYRAAILPTNQTQLDLPADSLAQVIIAHPLSTETSSSSPSIESSTLDRHIQVLMEYSENRVLQWGNKNPGINTKPSFANEADLQIQLLAWAAKYPGATFVVIGRCDDIGQEKPNIEPDAANIELAKKRAKKGLELLTKLLPGATGEVIAESQVCARGETTDWQANACRAKEASLADAVMMPEEKAEAINAAFNYGWLMRHRYPEHLNWVNTLDKSKDYERFRQQYRRFDIYAIGGQPTAEAVIIDEVTNTTDTANLRRSMIASVDSRAAPTVSSTNEMDYRVKLVARWASPYVTQLKDAIPVLAEAEFAWTPDTVPAIEGQPVLSSGTKVLTAYAKWIHDAHTGFTNTTLGLRSEGDADGLLSSENTILVSALAFGPALLSTVDLDQDVIGAGGRLAALIGVAVAGGNYFVDNGKVVLMSVEAQAQTSSIAQPTQGYQVSLLSDYVCTIHADSKVMGIQTKADRPLKIRYKSVGVEFDNTKTEWEKIGLVFDDQVSMEIEDSGQWQIDGVLADLLRIVDISFGTGSIWVEMGIAAALDIGIVEISQAIVRITYTDASPKFELRGFEIKADIPNILTSVGNLRIADGGLIRAGVAVDIAPPVGLSGNAALAMQKVNASATTPEYVFLSLLLGVQFSTPLPIGPTGMAIYGFIGSFTMHGRRNMGTNADPVARELDWWAKPAFDKYTKAHGQYALGLGVVVGTLPDLSFSFSAAGMLVMAYPNPEVILGVDVSLLTLPDTEATDEGGAAGNLTGLIVINDTAITIAVLGRYEIDNLLSIKVPFGAYFPSGGKGTYVRLGSDGNTDIAKPRYGEPITLTLLPTTINERAWAFLMIEQDGIEALHGNLDFSFDGFAVGFGAGWGIDWGSGKINLSASATILVGFGTKPLMIKGGIFVNGELNLGPISISARGSLTLTYMNDNVYLDGEFCGEVDLWFFSISGCVGVSIGSSHSLEAPEPPAPPLVSITLTDRHNKIMGMAAKVNYNDEVVLKKQAIFKIDENGNNIGAKPADNHTVWPDTAPVLQFSHYIHNALSADVQFAIESTPIQPKWFGSHQLKYTYRMDKLTLSDVTDPTNKKLVGEISVGQSKKLQSTWMTSPYRQSNSSGDNNPLPSEHEGPNLKLLDMNALSWVANMSNGAEGTDGDPAKTIEQVCEPLPAPKHGCVFGQSARSIGQFKIKIIQTPRATTPYPSRFYVVGQSVNRAFGRLIAGRDLAQLLASASNIALQPGRMIELPRAISRHGTALRQGYKLPAIQVIDQDTALCLPMPWEAMFDRQVLDPIVTLLVCRTSTYSTIAKKKCEAFETIKPYGSGLSKTKLELTDMTITTVNPNHNFSITDSVDKRVAPARAGRDGHADLSFPDSGIYVSFAQPGKQIEARFMILKPKDIKVQGYSEQGDRIVSKTLTSTRDEPLIVRLNARDPIQRIKITGGGNAAVLYQICVIPTNDLITATEPTEPTTKLICERFNDLKPVSRRQKTLKHSIFYITPLEADRYLQLVDAVDQRRKVPVVGRDGSLDIALPDTGIHVSLSAPCHYLELWVVSWAKSSIKAQAFNKDKKVIASMTVSGGAKEFHRIQLDPENTEDGITAFTLQGGRSEAVLFKICYKLPVETGKKRRLASLLDAERIDINKVIAHTQTTSTEADSATTSRVNSKISGVPKVTGIVNDDPSLMWDYKIINLPTLADDCYLVEYRPAPNNRQTAWNGFAIESQPNFDVSVLSICAIDKLAVDNQEADQAARQSLQEKIEHLLIELDANERREILLDAGCTYEIALDWSWQSWQPKDDETSPPDPVAADWTAGDSQRFQFAVAEESALADDTQDGLNEYIFDPRDIARYLKLVEPDNGQIAHFTEDPLWVHFETGHVEQLLARYDRKLWVEVKRTDPPPQSTFSRLQAILQSLKPKSLDWLNAPDQLNSLGYQRINEAVMQSPCLPDSTLMGGASLQASFELEPNAMYDFNLIALKDDESDPLVISASRFKTSIYAGADELIEHLGYDLSGSVNPYYPSDIILPSGTVIANSDLQVSDSLIDELLTIMGVDILPLPGRHPMTYAVWSLTDSNIHSHGDTNSSSWRLEGLFIDSLEPLKRTGAVASDDKAIIKDTLMLNKALISGQTLSVHSANKNWTRVFLKPAQPLLISDTTSHIALVFMSKEGIKTGKKTISNQPAIINREGL